MRNHARRIFNKIVSAGLAVGMVGSLAACGGGSSTSSVTPHLSGTVVKPAVTLTGIFGGGSSFVSLVARSLMDNYGVAIGPQPSGPVNNKVQILYASIGSGSGVGAFLTQTPATATPGNPPPPTSSQFPTYPYPEWDFAMSDAPLSASQISTYQSTDQTQRGPAVEVPVTSDGVAIPFNPSGLTYPGTGLQISVVTLCGIFTGNITNWNDSHITADNNGIQVSSNLPILVVHRADSSGTTFLTSNHLNTACASTIYPWTFGVGTVVNWPTTSGFDGETGSQGVAGKVAATAGAIGYVGPSFLGPPNNIPGSRLQDNFSLNHPTKPQWTTLNTASIIAALQTVTLPNNFTPTDILNNTIVPDASARGAWPIAGFTYADFYGCYKVKTMTDGLVGFIKWEDNTNKPGGQSVADKAILALGLVYLPTKLKSLSSAVVKNNVKTGPIPGTCTL